MLPTDGQRGRAAWRTSSRFAIVIMAMAMAMAMAALVLVPTVATASGLHVEHQAWARTGTVGPPNPGADLYVSAAGGQEQARAFVELAVGDVSSAVLAGARLVLATSSAESVLADTAHVTACAFTTPLAKNGQLDGPPPVTDCRKSAPVESDQNGLIVVPLGLFATSLTSGQMKGVVLLPSANDATPATFTVAIDPSKTSVLLPTPAPQTASGSPQEGGGSAPPAAGGGDGSAVALPPVTLAPAPAPDLAFTSPDVTMPKATVAGLAPAFPVPTVPVALASHRSWLGSVGIVVLTVLLAAIGLFAVRRFPAVLSLPTNGTVSVRLGTTLARKGLLWLVLPSLVMLLPETTAYKLGLIAIVYIAAIGLHILVNVAGEVSLGHAAFLGIPAFAVAHLSASTGLSPVYWVPLAVLVGAGIGLIVAGAAVRARGLQVALVTLAVAIGTVQFLFYQEWLIGPPEGFDVPTPSLFGIDLESNVARVPILTALVLLASLAGTTIIRSKIGRGLLLLRSSPDVAAAAGVNVALYRGAAYSIAGAFAGLAGACYVIWVRLVTPDAFPLELGFTYLLIAALAGRGGLGGVAVAAAVVQGGALFTFLPRNITLFLAPVVLILQVTRFEGGINAGLRDLRSWVGKRKRRAVMSSQTHPQPQAADTHLAVASVPVGTAVRIPSAIGILLLIAGFTSITVAWYNTGRTNQLWIQNQEIVSGGLVGLGLILLGCTLLLRDALLSGPALIRTTSNSLPVTVVPQELETPAPNPALAPSLSPSSSRPLVARAPRPRTRTREHSG